MSQIRVEPHSARWAKATDALVRECRSRVAGPAVSPGFGFQALSGNGLPSVAAGGSSLQGFVAIENERVRGAICASAQGSVEDLVLVPDNRSGETAEALLAAVEAWLRPRGGSQLQLFRAPGYGPSPEPLIGAGYRQRPAPAATLQVLDFSLLLSPIVEARRMDLIPLGPLRIELRPDPDPAREYQPRGAMIVISETEATVESPASAAADVVVSASRSDLTRFVLGALSPDTFFHSGARISPADLQHRARRAMTLLRTGVPWFNPLGDHR